MEPSTPNVNLWHLPQRQSPAAIFIMLWSTSVKLLKVLWPVLVLYLLKNETDNETLSSLWILIGFSFFSITGTVISYWFKKFYITEDNLIIQAGWLRKRTLSIPFRNIQAVHLEQNVWQQALKVAKVSFDATGSDKVEVQLDALSVGKAEDLKSLLMARVKDSGVQKDDTRAQQEDIMYSLSFTDLLKLSLTANHLEAFFILLALGFNILDELQQVFNVNGQDYINSYAREVFSQTAFIILLLFSGIAIASLLFSVLRTFIRYYGFTLTDTRRDWKIAFGLFNRQQRTVPLNKIQIIRWRATWLRRKVDYWILQVQSVGRKGKDQIPVIAFPQVVKLANSYQEFKGIDRANSYRIEPGFWKRKTFTIGLPVTIIPAIAAWFWVGWWAIGFILLFIYMTAYFYKSFQNFRWQTADEGIQLVSGVWGRKFTLLNWKKIQQVHIHQSPYQRKNALASVLFLTAGGRVVLPYLTLLNATALANHALYIVESRDENWM